MKSKLSLYFLSVAVLFFVSCSKELSLEKGVGPVGSGNFTANIGGNLWNADSLQLITVSADGVSINGLSKTGEQISMLLDAFKTGTYTLNATASSFAFYTNILAASPVGYVSNSGSASGTVTITSIDTVNHLVTGTFIMTLVNPADNTTRTITSGIFDHIPYTGSTGVGGMPPGTSDTLNCTIDGNPFLGATVESGIDSSTSTPQLTIAGLAIDGRDVALLLPVNITAGTYNLDFSTGSYIGIYGPNPTTVFVSMANGSVTITSNDMAARRIKGTFSFVASPLTSGTPVTITAGYFAVSY